MPMRGVGSKSSSADPCRGDHRRPHHSDEHEPIAIIGAGVRFPGGNESLDQFAEFLRRGGSGIRPVPEDRWDVAAFSSDDPEAKGKIRAAGFGFLDQIDQFDAPFFSISPLEAQYTDPQQRLLLEATWEALENANIDPVSLRHGNGGVYVGASSFDYALEMDSLPYEDVDGHLAAGIRSQGWARSWIELLYNRRRRPARRILSRADPGPHRGEHRQTPPVAPKTGCPMGDRLLHSRRQPIDRGDDHAGSVHVRPAGSCHPSRGHDAWCER